MLIWCQRKILLVGGLKGQVPNNRVSLSLLSCSDKEFASHTIALSDCLTDYNQASISCADLKVHLP
jgi:hypothetical protein